MTVDTHADARLTPSARLYLGGGLLLAVLAWGSCAWLLWRYVPVHAALFEGLATPLPRSAMLVVVAASWFIRLLPFLVLLAVLLGRVLLQPLLVAAMTGHSTAIKTWTILLSIAVLTGLVATAFIVHAMQAGCSQAKSDPRFEDELRDLNASGYDPCSVSWVP